MPWSYVKNLLTYFRINLKNSDHNIEADNGKCKGSTIPMVDLDKYAFKYWNEGEITHEYLFTIAYTEEIKGWEKVRTSTKFLRVILDAK